MLTGRGILTLGLAPTLALGLYTGHIMSSGADSPHPYPSPTTPTMILDEGDKEHMTYWYNGDGYEDQSGWDCATMGNRRCD